MVLKRHKWWLQIYFLFVNTNLDLSISLSFHDDGTKFCCLAHMFNAINLGNIVDFLFNKDFVIVLLVSRTSFVRCI